MNIYNSKNRTVNTYSCGLTLYPAQVHMLEAIGSNEGITLTETAELLFVSKPAVSQCIKQLCGAGLVRREGKGTAGGAMGLYLTDKGLSVYEEHRKRHAGLISAVGSVWGTLSPEARESITAMLSAAERSVLEMEE